MNTRFLNYVMTCVVCMSAAAVGQAQTFERRANLTGGGNPAEGRCAVALSVDGAADIEIHRDNVVVRNLKGQTPSLTRFECTAPMPVHAAGFQFAKIQGRGNVQLAQDPQGSGVAAVHIEDPQGGAGQYEFELRWNNGAPMAPPMVMQAPPRPRFGTDEAVRGCQDYVRDQAARRFRASDVVFRRTIMDDQPGRSDWVKGFLETRGGGGPNHFRFSCSVNFATGQVRSADLQPMQGDFGNAFGDGGTGRVIQACEASVEQRMAQDGFRRIDFGSVRMDDRPGRGEFVVGAASALEHDRPLWFDFSCSADLRGGTVRSAEVTPRR
jgi:hypothetical protein